LGAFLLGGNMKYYRLIFKCENGSAMISDLIEQEIDEQTFNTMNWEKPILRQFDGRHLHFMSLQREYLEAMVDGIQASKEIQKYDRAV
jgi:hypothetical protein